MGKSKIKVMLVGYFGDGALECSYETAFKELGHDANRFDIKKVIERYCRLGNIGRFFNKFVPVEPWIRKANREMVLHAWKIQPDVFLVFGQNHVLAGALAQVRSMFEVSTVLIWPDTLINLSESLIASLQLYDLVAAYGRNTVRQFENLGSRRIEWIPLAGDPDLHSANLHSVENDTFGGDIDFIGQWRPEREVVMQAILSQFPSFNIGIWGNDWGRRCRGKNDILRAWRGRPLYGEQFTNVVATSKINLNIIDPMNYPVANMRFFEIPVAGGLQVCSSCPEMESEFKHGETIFYYRDIEELLNLIRMLLENDSLRKRVAQAGHEKVLKAHTYTHRAQRILEVLNERSVA
jgi:uncharacterized protein (DUF983 family)